jgi:hypothetical protein
MIRNAAAQDIVAFLGILEPKNWPECLTLLVNQLDDQDTVHQEVCHHLHLVRSFLWMRLVFGGRQGHADSASPSLVMPEYLNGKSPLSITSRHRKTHPSMAYTPTPEGLPL